VVSLAQLRRLGFSYEEIRGMVRRGELVPLHRGVFILNRRSLPARGRLFGALLATAPDGFLSHRTAAGVYGLRAVNPYEIEVTTPGRPRSRSDLVIHRTTNLDPRDVRTYRGLRVSTIARMLIELATRETSEELNRLITESVHHNLFDVHKMKAALARHTRRPHTATIRQVLGAYIWTPRDKSTLERDFATWLATNPSIPPPQRNVHLGPYEIDCHWPEYRFGLELDGRPWHIAIKETDRDHAKDIWMQLHGQGIIRVTDFRFEHDKLGIRSDLHGFLRLGRAAA
jgi:hypothetical protein